MKLNSSITMQCLLSYCSPSVNLLTNPGSAPISPLFDQDSFEFPARYCVFLCDYLLFWFLNFKKHPLFHCSSVPNSISYPAISAFAEVEFYKRKKIRKKVWTNSRGRQIIKARKNPIDQERKFEDSMLFYFFLKFPRIKKEAKISTKLSP